MFSLSSQISIMPLIRFNGNDIRNRLRGLRIAFVGDSMGRTQWESFICLLMADISNKSSVYEVNGNRITKKAPYLAVRFSTFNFTVEYYRSPYLIQEGPPPRHVPRRVRRILRLDKVETTEMKWLQANIWYSTLDIGGQHQRHLLGILAISALVNITRRCVFVWMCFTVYVIVWSCWFIVKLVLGGSPLKAMIVLLCLTSWWHIQVNSWKEKLTDFILVGHDPRCNT